MTALSPHPPLAIGGTAARLLAALIALPLTAMAALAQAQPSREVQLERGRYLVDDVMQCGTFHHAPGPDGRANPAMEQAGGRIFQGSGLRSVNPNITPDAETGIGRWTEAQFADAMRNGRRPDGSLVGPPMPVEAYGDISDRDINAIWEYLRSLPAIRHAITERSRFAFELTRFEPPVLSVAEPPADDAARRGEYLAVALAHCMDCHSPRIAPDRADPSRTGGGGRVFPGPGGPLPARNITPHPEAGIGRWSEAEIWRAVAEAISPDGRRLYLPMSNRAAGWARTTGRDRADLIAYLRAMPALE